MARGRHGRAIRTLLVAALSVATLSGCAAGAAPVSGMAAGVAASPACPGQVPVSAVTAGLPSITLGCLGHSGSVALNRLGGRPVLVNLWASWCGPCRKEMPRIAAAVATAGGSTGPVVLGVDTNDAPAQASAFLAREHVGWPVVVDPSARLATALRLPGLPVTLGLDAAGRVVFRHIGELTESTALAAVRAVLAGGEPSAAPAATATATMGRTVP